MAFRRSTISIGGGTSKGVCIFHPHYTFLSFNNKPRGEKRRRTCVLCLCRTLKHALDDCACTRAVSCRLACYSWAVMWTIDLFLDMYS